MNPTFITPQPQNQPQDTAQPTTQPQPVSQPQATPQSYSPYYDQLMTPTTTVLEGGVAPISERVDPMIEIQRHRRKILFMTFIPLSLVLALLVLVGLRQYSLNRASQNNPRESPTNQLDQANLPSLNTDLAKFDAVDGVNISGDTKLNGTTTVTGTLIVAPTTPSGTPTAGQVYYDLQSNQLRLYNGSSYQSVISNDPTKIVCYLGADCGFLEDQDIATLKPLPQDLGVADNPTFNSVTLKNIKLGSPLSVEQGGTGITNFTPYVAPQALGVTDSPTFADPTFNSLTLNSLTADSITLNNPLSVPSGGTGKTSFTQFSLLVGNGTAAIETTSIPSQANLCLMSRLGNSPTFLPCPGGSGGATITAPVIGTENTIARFTGTSGTQIGDSAISDDGTDVTIGNGQNLVASTRIVTPILQSTGVLDISSGTDLNIGSNAQTFTLKGNRLSTVQAQDSGNYTYLKFAIPTNGVSGNTVTIPSETGTVCLRNSANCGFSLNGGGVVSVNNLIGTLSINNASVTGSNITINDALADGSTKGIASFNATNFSAAAGVINTIQGISNTATPQFASLTLTNGLSVTGGNITVSSGGSVKTNTIENVAATSGNNLSVTASGAGNNITFSINGGAQTFTFPTSGSTGQTICTSGISCATGGGQALILEPTGVQTLSGTVPSIFVNKQSGTGNLVQLQTAGVDKFVINNAGAITLDNAVVTNNITAGTIGSVNSAFTLRGNSSSVITSNQGSFSTTFGFNGNPTKNVTFRFPSDATLVDGSTYQICLSSGNCGSGGSDVTGSGTGGTIAKFTSNGSVIGDSILSESGTGINALLTVAGNATIQGSSGLTLGTNSVLGNVVINDGAGQNATLQTVSNLSSARTIKLPNANGTVAVSATGPITLDPTTGAISCASCLTTGGGGGPAAVNSLNTLTGALSIANATGSSATITIDDAAANGTTKGIATFNSTNFSASSGAINTIQGISSAASPTFTNLSLQGSGGITLGTGNSNAGKISFYDGSTGFKNVFTQASIVGGSDRAITIPGVSGTLAVTASGNINLTSAGNIQFSGTLPVSSGGTGGSNADTARNCSSGICAAKAGANSDLTSTTALNSITPSGSLTIGSIGLSDHQSFTLQGNDFSSFVVTDSATRTNLTTLSFATPSNGNAPGNAITFPNATGTICLSSGNCTGSGGSGASAALDNLASVAINTSLLPGAVNAVDLGSTAKPFRNLFVGSSSSAYASFNTSGISSNVSLKVPTTSGTIATNASGNIALDSVSGAISFTGTLAVSSGGTGATNLTDKSILIGNGTGAVTAIANSATAGQCLISGANASTAPAFGSCGGTGSGVTLQASYNNSSPAVINLAPANGGVFLRDAASTIGGTLFAVQNSAASTNYFAVTTTGISTSGSLNIGGLTAGAAYIGSNGLVSSEATLAVSRGGTGRSTFTSNGILYGNGTGAIAVTGSSSAAGQCLVTAAQAGVPSWTNCTGLVTLQNAYANGTNGSIDTTDARNIKFTLTNTATDSNFLVDVATGSLSKFAVQSAGTDVLGVTASSINLGTDLTFRNGANRTLSVAQAASGNGFDLNITAGAAAANNNGGNLVLTGGQGFNAPNSFGGSVNIQGASNSWFGGDVNITSGNGLYSSSVNIQVGSSNLTEISKGIFIGTTSTISGKTVSVGSFGSTTNISGSTLTLQSAANVTIGTSNSTGTLLVLDTKTSSGDPAGVAGGMYYNSSLGKMRCYEGVAWKDCTTDRPGAVWKVTNTAIGPGSFAYGNGTYIAFDYGCGTTAASCLLRSTDGVGWTSSGISGTVPSSISDATYGNGIFVAVGANGGISSSPDGLVWTVRATIGVSLNGITYANGTFVTVGRSSIVYTSKDGVNWKQSTGAASGNWNDVTYANGLYVAVSLNTGGASTGIIMTSPDGITWTLRTHASIGVSGTTSLAYGNGLFVTTGQNGSMTSPDGITWTYAGKISNSDYYTSIAYGNGLFVAGATNTSARVSVSTDGVNWTETHTNTNLSQTFANNSLSYQNGIFFGGNYSGGILSSGVASEGKSNSNSFQGGLTVYGASDASSSATALRVMGGVEATGSIPTSTTGSATTALHSQSTARVIRVQGRYAYVIGFDNSGFGNNFSILDITNPATPVTVGSMRSYSDPVDLAVQGRYAYVVNSCGGNGSCQYLAALDISRPSAPTFGSALLLPAFSRPSAIFVQGRYAYVTTEAGNQMLIIDISSVGSMSIVGSIAITEPRQIFVHGQYAYVSTSADTLQIYNVSNPASPASTGGSLSVAVNGPITVQGRYAYVATGSGFQIIDVSNPASPTSVGTLTGSFSGQVTVQGRYAYIASGQIVDISTPASPTLVGTINIVSGASISISGRYLYSLSTTRTMNIYNVGGSYIQQLEVGGIETSTLQTNGSANIDGSLSVTGSASITNSLQVGNLGVAGSTTIKAYSAVAFNVQNSAGFSSLTADTINSKTIFNRPSTGDVIEFQVAGTTYGSINVNSTSGTVSYNAFTGSHYGLFATGSTPAVNGQIVDLTGNNNYRDGSSEPFYGITTTTTANSPNVLGGYLGTTNSATAASLDNPELIMAAGNGDIWIADNGSGNVMIGDPLMSSSVAGHAMRDPGTFATSHIFAKSAENIDWSTITATVNGVKVAKVSVLFSFYNVENNSILSILQGSSLAISGDSVFGGNVDIAANLNVTGTSTLTDLTVTGNTVLAELTVERIITTGNTPEAVLGATTGQNSTVSINGNDSAGTISFTAGTETLPDFTLASGNQVSVTFDKAYGAAPRVTLTPNSEMAANVRYYVQQTTTGFSIVFTDTPTAGAAYSFNYQVIQ